MNSLLVLANVVGCCLLAAGTLRRIEQEPPLATLPKFVMLLLTFMAAYCAIEALSWTRPIPPGEAMLVLIWGVVSVWRAFAPPGACFLRALSYWERNAVAPHPPGTPPA